MPDENHRVALGGVSPCLRVHLRHERAGRVDRPQRARRGAGTNGGSDPVRREDDESALGHVLDAGDEDGAALTKLIDDVRVVHDLFSDVDGRPVLRERALDGLHRSLDACAVSARRREQDPLDHAANVAAPRKKRADLTETSTPLIRAAVVLSRTTATKPPEASLATPEHKRPRRPTRRGRSTRRQSPRPYRNKQDRKGPPLGGSWRRTLSIAHRRHCESRPTVRIAPVTETLARVDALANRPTGLSLKRGLGARQRRFQGLSTGHFAPPIIPRAQ